jgi:hypothetical protein
MHRCRISTPFSCCTHRHFVVRATRPLNVTTQLAVIFAASCKKSFRWSDGAWQIRPDITLVKYRNQRGFSCNFVAYACNLKMMRVWEAGCVWNQWSVIKKYCSFVSLYRNNYLRVRFMLVCYVIIYFHNYYYWFQDYNFCYVECIY